MKSSEWKDDQSLSARVSVKVPAFLRHYAKAADRRVEEGDAPFGSQLDGTVQGKSWSKGGENLPVINVPCLPARSAVHDGVYSRAKVCDAPSDKLDVLNGAERCIVTNAAEARVPLGRFSSGVILEPMESQPLMNMFCAGQRLEGHSAPRCGSPKKSFGANVSDKAPSARQKISVNNTAASVPTQTLALNKLYSSLKKMKSRRGEACMEDLAAVSNGKDSSFSRSFLNKILGAQNSVCTPREREEVYILLGGKSRPVRLQFQTDGLHLVRENEWGVDLKSREGLLCEMDRESLALLEKFRERYRLVSRSPQALDKKLIRNSQFPWARHVVYKGDLYEEKDQIMEKDSGSKLSIHVYLPNAGWEMHETQGVMEL